MAYCSGGENKTLHKTIFLGYLSISGSLCSLSVLSVKWQRLYLAAFALFKAPHIHLYMPSPGRTPSAVVQRWPKCRAVPRASLTPGPHLSDGSWLQRELCPPWMEKEVRRNPGGQGDVCSQGEIKDLTLSVKQPEVFISALVNEGILIYNC